MSTSAESASLPTFSWLEIDAFHLGSGLPIVRRRGIDQREARSISRIARRRHERRRW